MRILYLSCHETLEYYELKMLTELGHNVFSVGFYLDPKNPYNPTREKLNFDANEDIRKEFDKIYPKYKPLITDLKLPQQFVDNFDMVITCHYMHNLDFKKLKDKCVYRSIAITIDVWEKELIKGLEHGLKIVRMSPQETNVPFYAGGNCIIRQSVDKNDFSGWTGEIGKVLTINKWMKKRAWCCEYDFYELITRHFPRCLVGLENEDIPHAISNASYRDMLDYLKNHRVYFSTCSKPGPVTYTFIEALMTGIPVVSIGPNRGNAHHPSYGNTFEAHKFVAEGCWSDNPAILRSRIKNILEDYELAQSLSKTGRKIAVENFDYEIAKEGWRKFLS